MSLVKSVRTQRAIGRVGLILLLVIGLAMVLMPMAWMLSTALQKRGTTLRMPPEWIPQDEITVQLDGQKCYLYDIPVDGQTRRLALLDKNGPNGVFVNPEDLNEKYELPVLDGVRATRVALHWENFPQSLSVLPFGRFLFNTGELVVLGTLGTVLSCSFIAYGFARYRAPGLNVLFLILLSTLMLPSQVTLIPTFVVFQKIGWYDTLLPLIVPAFFGSAWDIFLLRQYMMTIPLELDDAARIDGCGALGVFWNVIVPQIMPALATVAIFTALYIWNDFFGPLIYLRSQSHWTVALGLQSFSALYRRETQLLMAASTITMLPCVLIFFFAQRLFIQGIVVSGVKG